MVGLASTGGHRGGLARLASDGGSVRYSWTSPTLTPTPKGNRLGLMVRLASTGGHREWKQRFTHTEAAREITLAAYASVNQSLVVYAAENAICVPAAPACGLSVRYIK